MLTKPIETIQTKRAVLYCRVSTKEQVEEGNSLSTQEKNCREYAKKHGYEVAAIYIEQGESAKTADRTELKKLMSFCAMKKNKISAVISYKIDRISRNIDDYSQIRIQLKRYGVEIKSTSENFEDTPTGRFMENIIANVAQFDNDVRAERCAGGMKDAVREGRYVWMAPYGYSNVRINGKATIAPNHLAPVIGKVFEEIASDIHSVEEIRKNFNERVATDTLGKPIARSYFYRIVRNELYAGWINKFGERVKGDFKAIISDELFAKVQIILSAKRKNTQEYKILNPDFPLRKFFYHESGKALTGYWAQGRKQKYPYYKVPMTKLNIRKEVLEETFKDWLNYFKLDVGCFDTLHSYFKSHVENRFSANVANSAKTQSEIAALKTRIDVLLDKNISGIITDELCREKITALNAHIYTLSKSIIELGEIKPCLSSMLKMIRDVLFNPANLWDKATLETRIKLQWFYFPEGIEISENGSRTTKVCRLFKLKEVFLRTKSPVVDYRNRKLNTDNWQILEIGNKSLETSILDKANETNILVGLMEEVTQLAKIIEESEAGDQSHLTYAT